MWYCAVDVVDVGVVLLMWYCPVDVVDVGVVLLMWYCPVDVGIVLLMWVLSCNAGLSAGTHCCVPNISSPSHTTHPSPASPLLHHTPHTLLLCSPSILHHTPHTLPCSSGVLQTTQDQPHPLLAPPSHKGHTRKLSSYWDWRCHGHTVGFST